MIDYIKGTIEELTATETTVENNGIGYKILISLQTYEALNGTKETKIYIHHYLREDEELYYGFATKDERTVQTPYRSVRNRSFNRTNDAILTHLRRD